MGWRDGAFGRLAGVDAGLKVWSVLARWKTEADGGTTGGGRAVWRRHGHWRLQLGLGFDRAWVYASVLVPNSFYFK